MELVGSYHGADEYGHGSPQSWGWLSRPELGKRARRSPLPTPRSFCDVRSLTTPMLAQLIAHPINGYVTKSTARPSQLSQVWLISVLTTWLIPTGYGPLPGVIQKSFTPRLGGYRFNSVCEGIWEFPSSLLPPPSPSHLSFLPSFVHPVFQVVIYSSIRSFMNSSIHLFIYSCTATTLIYNLYSFMYPFIKTYIDPLILLIKPGIIKDIMRISWC